MADAAKDAAVAEAGSSRRQPVGVLTDPASSRDTAYITHPAVFMFVERSTSSSRKRIRKRNTSPAKVLDDARDQSGGLSQ